MLQPSSSPAAPEAGVSAAQENRARGATAALDIDPRWRAGQKLIEARRQLGLSLDEIAERIRVRKDYLEALEQMDVKLLPGKAYALAFLRSYADTLGIDAKAIVEQFREECPLTRDAGDPPVRVPASRPRRERPWIAAAALLVAGVGFVAWRALDRQSGAEIVAEPSSVGVAVALPTAHAIATAESRVVEIKAVAEAWLEARGPDGTVFFSRTLRAGEVYRPDPSPGWTLHARDGGAFELFVNGAPAGMMGPPSMPVLGRAIDEIQPTAQAELAAPQT